MPEVDMGSYNYSGGDVTFRDFYSDIYYPDKTKCFNDAEIIENNEIASCTLKNFPTKIEHCIKFAKNVFLEIFDNWNLTNSYIDYNKLGVMSSINYFLN